MRPALGARNPAIMANSVVLPAPFGPISAVMRPDSAASDARSTASRPPKRLETLSTRRSGSAIAPPQQSNQATRRKCDGEDQDAAIDDEIEPRRITGDKLGRLAQAADYQRAQQRA